jgi:hypothetical protein
LTNSLRFMADSKRHITPENIDEWLSSTGFLFPRNELEIARFERLFGMPGENSTGDEIDPARIINGKLGLGIIVKMKSTENQIDYSEYKMVARNGSSVPKHILDKMKKNQESRKNDDGSTKDGDK